MDRASFLSALPFCLPTSFATLPHSSDESEVEVLLESNQQRKFFLSLEPVEGKPAYFVDDDEDPSMTPISLALECMQQSEKERGGNHKTQTEYFALCLYAKIQSRIYVWRMSDLQRIKYVPSQQSKPSCLLFQFAACRFRLFSPSNDTNTVLQQVLSRLQLLWPAGKSAWEQGWWLAQQQQLRGLDSPASHTSHQCENNSGGSRVEKKHQLVAEEEPESKRRSWTKTLNQLDTVLSSTRQSKENANTLKDTVEVLLQESATGLHDCFQAHQLQQQQQQQQGVDKEESTNESKLEEALSTFFPARRRSKNPKPTTSDDNAKEICQQAVLNLLQQHRKATHEMALSCLLPSRD